MVIRRRLALSGPALAFITTGVQNAVPIFAHPTAVSLVLKQLGETVAYEKLSLLGYVIMPTHAHLLLGFPEIERLSAVIRDFKRLSARRVKGILDDGQIARLLYKGGYKLLQRRFDDVVIFSEEQFRTKLNYIHQNPVRAGLVANETDYPYSSAGDWMERGSGPLRVDKEWGWLKSAGT